jgi:hypothetical protein
MLEAVFSVRSVPTLCNKDQLPLRDSGPYYRNDSAEKKNIAGRDSKGAWLKDELIGGKPLVVK